MGRIGAARFHREAVGGQAVAARMEVARVLEIFPVRAAEQVAAAAQAAVGPAVAVLAVDQVGVPHVAAAH